MISDDKNSKAGDCMYTKTVSLTMQVESVRVPQDMYSTVLKHHTRDLEDDVVIESVQAPHMQTRIIHRLFLQVT